MGVKVVVLWEDAGADEFLLEDVDEVQEVFGAVVADVVEGVWWDWKAVVAGGTVGGFLHDADYAFDDVVDVGEVAFAVAVVEDLDGLACAEFVGEAEVGHVRTAGGAVDGEKSQSGRRDIVEFAVGVGHELVAFLGGGVEGDWIINLIIGAIRHLLVASVD